MRTVDQTLGSYRREQIQGDRKRAQDLGRDSEVDRGCLLEHGDIYTLVEQVRYRMDPVKLACRDGEQWVATQKKPCARLYHPPVSRSSARSPRGEHDLAVLLALTLRTVGRGFDRVPPSVPAALFRSA